MSVTIKSSNTSTMSMDDFTLVNSNSNSTWSTLSEIATEPNDSKDPVDLSKIDRKPLSKHEFTEFWINLVQEQQKIEEHDIDGPTETDNWFLDKYFDVDDSKETTKKLQPENDDLDMDAI